MTFGDSFKNPFKTIAFYLSAVLFNMLSYSLFNRGTNIFTSVRKKKSAESCSTFNEEIGTKEFLLLSFQHFVMFPFDRLARKSDFLVNENIWKIRTKTDTSK